MQKLKERRCKGIVIFKNKMHFNINSHLIRKRSNGIYKKSDGIQNQISQAGAGAQLPRSPNLVYK